MRDVVCQSLRVITTLLLSMLATLSFFCLLAQAQEHPSLEIRVVPQAEYAVAGQIFTYTIIVTNVGRMSIQDFIVFTETPTGTTFARASHNANWFVSELTPGETGNIGWATREPVTPGTVVNFELVVNVLPEMADQQLLSGQYGIVSMGGGDMIAAGPAIETNILATVPTAAPTPLPTATATTTSTSIATPSVTSTPRPTSTALPVVTPGPTSTSPAKTTAEATSSSSTTILFVVGGLSLLLMIILSLIWSFKRR
jgi:uncharacterized repeat protein (TIGR01451 family)